MIYQYSGRKTANTKLLSSGFHVKCLSEIDYSLEYRKLTEEELNHEADAFLSEPRLMSREGYINQIKNNYYWKKIDNYQQKLICDLKEMIGIYDYILIKFCRDIIPVLQEENIPFAFISPKNEISILHEWMGRCFYKHGVSGIVQRLRLDWASDIAKIKNSKIPCIWLENGQYAYDAIISYNSNNFDLTTT